jgi:hypothetical protein
VICEVDSDWLLGRGQKVADMLTPLGGTRRLAHAVLGLRNETVIPVYSGTRPTFEYRDWRFGTTVMGIRGSYFERWIPSDEKRTRFYLDRAYLHLYWQLRAQDDEKELLALHCDPNETDDAGPLRHAHYKRGPHIHVSASEYPLPHSHFALNATQLDEILSSAERLSEAFSSGVVLVRDQVLDVFEAQG